MLGPFHLAAILAVAATIAALIARNAVHGLLYFVSSLLAVAVMFALLGAPFAAALQIIVYAGAIMVLFVFAVMILGVGEESIAQERRWLRPRALLFPFLLAAAAAALFGWASASQRYAAGALVGTRDVGRALFGPHLLEVELASLVLLAALIGTLHLGRKRREVEP